MSWRGNKKKSIAFLTGLVFMLSMVFGISPAYAGATELTISDITASSFKVSWPSATKAKKYAISVKNSVAEEVYAASEITDLQCVVNGLNAGSSYDVTVNAKPTNDAYWETAGVNSLQKTGIETLKPAFLKLAEITKQGDISLTFSKAMANPEGTQSQFVVKMGDDDVAVNSVATTNTAEKIKLDLEPYTTVNQIISINYTKGDDESLQIKSTDGVAVESFVAQIGAAAPALSADTTENILGEDVEITFAANAEWVAAITDITVDAISIAGKYNVGNGLITIKSEVFSLPGDYFISVKSNGYNDATVTQTILAGQDTLDNLVIFQKPYISETGITRGIGLEGEFRVGFAEQIEASTLQISLNRTGTLKTPDQEKSHVAFTYELTQNNSSLCVKTNALLEYGTYYELVLAAGLKDIQGNTTATEEKVAFCTVPFKQPVYKIIKNGQEVNSVQLGETYQLVATLENGSDKTQTVDAILQLRGGKGVRGTYGGTVLAQSVQEINKLNAGKNTNITIDFTIPQDLDSFEVYGDIFTWEKDGKSASSKPFHFSCPVE